MTMTRKDYIAIAAELKFASPDQSRDSWASDDALIQWETDCRSVAEVLARNNGRFDRDWFLRACGVEQ